MCTIFNHFLINLVYLFVEKLKAFLVNLKLTTLFEGILLCSSSPPLIDKNLPKLEFSSLLTPWAQIYKFCWKGLESIIFPLPPSQISSIWCIAKYTHQKPFGPTYYPKTFVPIQTMNEASGLWDWQKKISWGLVMKSTWISFWKKFVVVCFHKNHLGLKITKYMCFALLIWQCYGHGQLSHWQDELKIEKSCSFLDLKLSYIS